jgi:prepilin-type N-terminal cleavage/methylation domain-containing protein
MKHRWTERRAFTLIELMMVVAIIGVLASLLLAAIFRIRPVAEELEAHREIVGLHNAIISFSTDARFGNVGYLPSQCDPSGADPVSMSYIKKVWPYSLGGLALPQAMLEGDQCLVLFLGGPKNGGWAVDAVDPTATYGNRIRFYEFDAARLKDIHGNGYMSYLDRWGTPYAYFSPMRESITWQQPGYLQDCKKIGQMFTKNPGQGLTAYLGVNLNSFQIICAGRDKFFGQHGATWTGGNAQTTYPTIDPGHDDLTNFCNTKMGSKQ